MSAPSKADAKGRTSEESDAAFRYNPESDDAPAIVAEVLEHGCVLGVSDVFFCAEETQFGIAARHLGLWRQVSEIPTDVGRRCIAHIKSMASMDIAERRRPLDGRWIFERDSGEKIDLRISTIPTLYGEDCTIRFLLRETQLLDLDKLGMMQRDHNFLLQMLNSPSGLILVTGPTGSGKTTTLYACVNYLNNGVRKINTIEDPVEYALLHVRQSQVNPMIDLHFAEILKGVLRQAPDVIMIGEIRDPETAAIAVRAANSGHLVLATLHAPIAAAAVQSMLSFGAHPYQLASCLLGSIAQRLVRTLDPKTRVAYDLGMIPGLFDEVKQWLPPGEGRGEKIYGPGPSTNGALGGYSGRTGVFEVMPITQEIRRLIMEQQPTPVLRNQAKKEGLIEMREGALLKVARGETSVEEVFRAIPAEYLGVEI